jgi:DNA-binding MarR family transcriptional regulator
MKPAVHPRTEGVAFYTAHSYRVGDSIGALIRQLRLSMTKSVDAEMATHGLTDAQWGPLFLIAAGRGRTAAALAQELAVNAGAMTRTLDRLEKKGLLLRCRSADDRRLVMLELTEDGKRAAARVPAALAAVYNAHLAGFSEEEFATLKSMLARMVANGTRLHAAQAAAA